jgi:hypothetical protein
MNQSDAWCMIRRRAKAAGITAEIGCHTFRATGDHCLPRQWWCARARARNGRPREPAHDQALRPHEGAAHLGQGRENTALKPLAGTGTFEFETASGVCTELQCRSYIFMDATYGRNLDRDGAPTKAFEPQPLPDCTRDF